MICLRFVPYVFDRDGERVDVSIAPMKRADALQTESSPKWQTAWTSEYLILFLNKLLTNEHKCAIIVKGDDYGKKIRNQ